MIGQTLSYFCKKLEVKEKGSDGEEHFDVKQTQMPCSSPTETFIQGDSTDNDASMHSGHASGPIYQHRLWSRTNLEEISLSRLIELAHLPTSRKKISDLSLLRMTCYPQ